jgi:hypothetical protein
LSGWIQTSAGWMTSKDNGSMHEWMSVAGGIKIRNNQKIRWLTAIVWTHKTLFHHLNNGNQQKNVKLVAVPQHLRNVSIRQRKKKQNTGDYIQWTNCGKSFRLSSWFRIKIRMIINFWKFSNFTQISTRID